MIKKRMTALLTALVMMLSLLPVDARAAADDGYTFDERTGVLIITSQKTMPTIPDEVKGKTTSIVIASSANHTIGESAKNPAFIDQFTGFSNLTSFSVKDGNTVYSALDGVLFNKDQTKLICYPQGRHESKYVIPPSVTSIVESAFSGVSGLTIYSSRNYDIRLVNATFAKQVLFYSSPVKSIRLGENAVTLNPGDTTRLTAIVDSNPEAPEGATISEVIWSSGNPAVATVDETTGEVTAVAVGTAVITATTLGSDSSGKRLTADCTVTVAQPVSSLIPVDTSGNAAQTGSSEVPLVLNTSDPIVLSVMVNENATDKTVTWTTENAGITLSSYSGASAATPAGLRLSAIGTSLIGRLLHADGAAAQSIGVTATQIDGKYISSVTVTPSADSESRNVSVTATAASQSQTFYLNLSKWVTSVTLADSDKPLYLHPSGAETLTATIEPGDATDKSVAWSSSDGNVATVDSNGKVTAVAAGDATITVKANDQKSANGTPIQVSRTVSVRDISLNKTTLELKHHGTETLTATVAPAGKDVTWKSSNTDIVTVDAAGKVEAVASAGTATITATMTESGFTAECAVTVVPLPVESVSLSATGLSDGKLTLELSTTDTPTTTALTATLNPTNATNQNLNWWSSNSSAVSINTEGAAAVVGNPYAVTAGSGKYTITITAVEEGEADIYVSAADGAKQAVCHVLVPTKVKNFSLNKTSLTLYPNGSEQLEPRFGSDNPTNQGVTWQSSDTNVVTVSENGLVSVSPSLVFAANEADTAHTATITATTQDGTGKTATCNVTVIRNKVTSVRLDNDKLDLNLTDADKKTGTLEATVSPSDATFKDVTWHSDNGSVAEVNVDTDGKATVTAVAPGTATITVTTADQGFTANCAVTVAKINVTGITMSATSKELSVTDNGNKSFDLTATIKPEDAPGNAINRNLIWTVDAAGSDVVQLSTDHTNAAAATVTVTALKAGTATITATSEENGTIKGTCIVTIPETKVTALALSDTGFELNVGSEKNVTVTVTPSNATNKTVNWSSDAPAVATVERVSDTTAVVKAIGHGTAHISATPADGSSVSASCTVNVYVPATGITLKNATTLTMGSNATETLTATVNPTGAKQEIAWSVTEGSDIVSVDATGKVTALKAGTAVVTATSTANSAAKASCTVTVVQPTNSVTVAPKSATLKINGTDTDKTTTLTATLDPGDASSAVTWSSDNVSVATVDGSGKVTAVGKGTATITATSGGKADACTITVEALASGVTLGKIQLTLEKNRSETLIATVRPDNADDKTVTWTTSDENVATVDENGTVTVKADAADNATATIKATINGHTATCTVTAIPVKVTGLEFTALPEGNKIAWKGTFTLKAKVSPEDAANKAVTWGSSDPSVLSLGEPALENGVSSVVVTANKVGFAAITATSAENGEVKQTVTISVPGVPATSVSLSPAEATLYLNIPAGNTNESLKGSEQLIAAVNPNNTTDGVTSWTSSNTRVATVDQSGNVTAKDVGTATITATAGGKTSTCTVTVKALATEVKLNQSTLTLEKDRSETLTVTVTPGNAANKTVQWSSSAPTVATVDSTGKVTAKAVGTATITATAQDGSGVSADCTVTVNAISVKGVSLSPQKLTLEASGSATLTAEIEPSDAAVQELSWESSNNAVVTVTPGENGTATVTAVKATDGNTAASATITVKTTDGNHTATCDITVQPTPVTGMTIKNGETSISELTIPYKDRGTNKPTLSAAVEPSTATDKTVTWSSSNTSVATVDQNGKVTAVKPGTAVITARSNSNGLIAATCDVEVTSVKVTGVSLDMSQLELDIGNTASTFQLTATVLPEGDDGADDKSVTWSSSDESVAKVDTQGKVTAVGEGTAVITVMTTDQSKTATCVVRVWQKVTGVTIKKDNAAASSLTLDVGASEVLTADVAPGNAANKNVKWSSSNTAVATVDAAGRVTAIAAGTATITVTTEDQDKSATCEVTVSNVAVSGVTLSQTELTLMNGNEKTISATVTPSNATDKTVTWESSDTNVAAVDQNGKITAVGAGTANITATAGGVTSSACVVTVYEDATGVTLDKNGQTVELTLVAGETAPTLALAAAVTPSGAKQAFTWSSSNTTVATVAAGENGAATVTANATGTAVITVTATGTGFSKSCTVTVAQHTTGIKLDKSTLSFDLSTATKTATLKATLAPLTSTDDVKWEISGDAASVQLSAPSTANGVSTVTVYALKAKDDGSDATATITATSGKEDAKHSATCTVTVKNPATGILLNKAELTLAKNGSDTLTATILPADAQSPTVTWRSDDENIAAVAGGAVTAKAAGSTTVTASITVDGKTYSKSCAVTVTPLLADSIELVSAETLEIGDTKTLSATAKRNDENAPDNVSLTWSSSSEDVAKVDSNGLVTALKAGATVITVTDGGSGKTATCLVTVIPITVSSISLNKTTLSLNEGTNETLVATILPANATDKAVTWRSNNESIATVDSTGKVTAQKAGTAVITATAHGDESKTTSCTVTVIAPVTGVSLNKTTLALTTGGSETLTATISPANASNPAVTWSSGTQGVATVDENGTVSAVAAGTAVVTVKTTDGGYTATCTVTVTDPAVPVSSVAIKKDGAAVTDTLSLPLSGGTVQLQAVIDPVGATNQNVSWSSTNNAVATVVGGLVTPVGTGTAAIIVTTEDGGKTASCTVVVTRLASGVTLDKGTLDLAAGHNGTLTATVSGDPSDASVTWESSNSGVATVAANGVVTGVAAGIATITAKTADGSEKTAECSVTVFAPVTSVAIKKGSESVNSIALGMVTEKTASLTAAADPAGVENVTYSWSSDDANVATVGSSGADTTVTAKGAGTAIITVTATTGDISVQKSVTVTVSKAAISDIPTSLEFNSSHTSESIVFSPLADDTEITWNGTNDGVVQHDFSRSGSTRTDTFTALKNGTITLTWTKPSDALCETASGSLTIRSIIDPIEDASATPNDPSASLTASVDQNTRTINVAGYSTSGSDEDVDFDFGPDDYELKYTLASDDLLANRNGNTVTVTQAGTDFSIDYSIEENITQIPKNMTISASVSLVSDGDINSASMQINDVTQQHLKEAVTSVYKKDIDYVDIDIDDEITEYDLDISLSVSQSVDTEVNALQLDITPSYQLYANGVKTSEGEIHNLGSAVKVTVETNFEPAEIIHQYYENGVLKVESLRFTCTEVFDFDGDTSCYIVTWEQQHFSIVDLIPAESLEIYHEKLDEKLKPEPQPEPTPDKPSRPVTPVIVDGTPTPVTPVKPDIKPDPAFNQPATTAKVFADVSASHWAAEAIGFVTARGIFNGVSDKMFAPELAMNRGMIVQMLYNFDDGDKSTDAAVFADAAGKWYETASRWATGIGVTNGDGNKFNGDANVTREQMAAMLYRYARLKGYDVSFDSTALGSFSDAASVSGWAHDAMCWAVSKGLINGTGRGLEPGGNATRAQVAAIMMRFCENIVSGRTA